MARAAKAFHQMSDQQVRYRRSTLNDLVLAQRRTEALLRSMREPPILLDSLEHAAPLLTKHVRYLFVIDLKSLN